MAPRVLLLLMALFTALLAGCADGPSDDDGDTDNGAPPVVGACSDLGFANIPSVTEERNLTFQVTVNCPFPWESEHVAAHYATESNDEGSLQHYTNACTIMTGAANDSTIDIPCGIDTPGTYHIRGHAIVPIGGEATHFWSDEYLLVVREAGQGLPGGVTVTLWDVPSRPVAGHAYDLRTEVSWAIAPPGVAAQEVNARWGNTSHAGEEPDTSAYPNACEGATGNVPGSFNVTCTFPEAGAVFVRGHARFENGGVVQDYWGEELAIEAQAS